jgi:hypothetical protein
MKAGSKRAPIGARLAQKLVDDRGCWIWTGKTTNRRYGLIGWRGRSWLVHRVAWVLRHGELAPDVLVLHRCDRPPCCNPDHLFVGSQRDNVRDCIAKKRFRVPNGAAHYRAKLTPASARAIRELARDGWGYRRLARRFGVHRGTIGAVIRRRTWKTA